VVNFTSPTFTIPNLEGMDVPYVVTSSNIKETTTIDITTQQETTIDEDGIGNMFRDTGNPLGSTTKNVSTLLSHPSSLVDQALPSSQGQSNHL